MASATSTLTPLSISSSSKAPSPRLQAPAQCLTVPPTKTSPYCAGAGAGTGTGRKHARNVSTMATTGEAPAEVVSVATTDTETPKIVTKIQQAWDKVEDKYAVTSLAVAGGVGLVACAGVISAIDKLPLIPGVLELVGIGYTGYFAYRNLLSKPSREALIQKIKGTYSDIIGTS